MNSIVPDLRAIKLIGAKADFYCEEAPSGYHFLPIAKGRAVGMPGIGEQMSIHEHDFDRMLDCIESMQRDFPELANSAVPSGITRLWASSLGWPGWLLSGTDLSGTGSLPGSIRLKDDLRLVANLLRHEGESRLLALLCEWPRYPGQSTILAAPDLRSAIWMRTDSIKRRNEPIRISVEAGPAEDTVRIDLHPALGPFRSIYEGVILLVYLAMVRTFAGIVSGGIDAFSSISIKQMHSGPDLARLLAVPTERSRSIASMTLPMELLVINNPEFDPVLWQALAGKHGIPLMAENPGKHAGPGTVSAMIERAIVNQARPPQISEIAETLSISERTLSRRLAGAGTSFRQLIIGAQMRLAQDLLRTTKLSVDAIAQEVGYNHASAFIRSFKQATGATPADWRNQAIKADGGVRQEDDLPYLG